MRTLKIFTAIFFIGILLTSCSKNDKNTEDAKLNIRLTDAPGNYDSVLIDIQQVEIITDQGKQTFPLINPGIYNLLDYSNGLDTLLVTGSFPASRLNQIRLILGFNNTVVLNGQSYTLNTPSAQQSGLKLNVQKDLIAGGEYTYTLDFDAARSVVSMGNGSFNLKPVIRVITEAISGAIEGQVDPANAAYYSFIVNGTDTMGTSIDSTGYFKIIAVPAGSYDLNVLANPGFSNQIENGVQVVNGQVTDVGTLNF
ncbi:MAG: DUF4382 domain-containing protein [Chitinophagales bacterium]